MKVPILVVRDFHGDFFTFLYVSVRPQLSYERSDFTRGIFASAKTFKGDFPGYF